MAMKKRDFVALADTLKQARNSYGKNWDPAQLNRRAGKKFRVLPAPRKKYSGYGGLNSPASAGTLQ